MKILLNNIDLNEALYDKSNVGFVPTMGSLHMGHISLIKKSIKQCRNTIVSIFVNPKQFNSKKDFNKYPRNLSKDLQLCKKLKVNYVFIPKIKHIYNAQKEIKIQLKKNEKILCAKYRKGHFEGVIDVMTRLTKLIKPSKIFMGEKDFQQLLLVKKYIENYYDVKIISCKTIRDKNKVALSSRNFLLSKNELNRAGKIAKKLISLRKNTFGKKNSKIIFKNLKNEFKNLYDVHIEYLEMRNQKNLKITSKKKNAKIFIAYYINNVRLIDNF